MKHRFAVTLALAGVITVAPVFTAAAERQTGGTTTQRGTTTQPAPAAPPAPAAAATPKTPAAPPRLMLVAPNVSYKVSGLLPTPVTLVGSGFTQSAFVTVTIKGTPYVAHNLYNCSFNVNAYGFVNVNHCMVEIPFNVATGSGTIMVTDFGTPSNALRFSIQ